MINFIIESGDVIAGFALLFSIYATFKTVQFNNRQQKLIDTQEKLNQLLLNREASDIELDKQAELGASILKLGNNKYRLKIWNKGKAPAQDVSIEFPESNEIISEREVNEKFPLQFLDAHQAVELIAVIGVSTKSKHLIKLEWTDGRVQRVEKSIWVTI
ncbi:hypothetical protein NF675_14935 [Pseudomonas siliginis]|uniref:hypothetical protein n=1 Tax=Pseudomonas siliginis TaxID=2842346 RepID=UPI0020921612|nr:hypothetical protein [Pseudomonas siliginis]UST72308.1 hypothetical protein NF675_14935 [Pseudomonas siliginis]